MSEYACPIHQLEVLHVSSLVSKVPMEIGNSACRSNQPSPDYPTINKHALQYLTSAHYSSQLRNVSEREEARNNSFSHASRLHDDESFSIGLSFLWRCVGLVDFNYRRRAHEIERERESRRAASIEIIIPTKKRSRTSRVGAIQLKFLD